MAVFEKLSGNRLHTTNVTALSVPANQASNPQEQK